MTTEGNNGGPLSEQHEGYQGGRRGRLRQQNFPSHCFFFDHTGACCTEYLCTFVGAYRFFTWATLPNGVHYLITTTIIL